MKILAAALIAAVLAFPAAAKPPTVKVTMTAGAKKLLEKHGTTLDGGVLRKLGARDGADLGDGSDLVHAVVDPKDEDALVVGDYLDGRLNVALRVGFNELGSVISPYNEPEETLAKLFPPLPAASASGPRPPGQSCDKIKSANKIMELAGSDLVSSPCEALGKAGCDPEKVWAALRRLYILRLTAVPGDAVGRAAAEFLQTSSVTFKTVDLTLKMDARTLALYEPQTDRVELPVELFKPLWPLLKGSVPPPEASKIVETTAPSLVHELRHARQAHALGFADPGTGFYETEGLAYADEALFLWARLEVEPDYAGMRAFDRVLMSTAGLPATPSPWWKQPLDPAELPRLRELKGAAKAAMGAALRPDTVNDWFIARALAGGLDSMDSIVRRTLLQDESHPSVYDWSDGYRKQYAAANEQTLKKLSDCRDAETDPSERKYFERIIKERMDDQRFYEDPAKYERLVEYFKTERARQQTQLDRFRRRPK